MIDVGDGSACVRLFVVWKSCRKAESAMCGQAGSDVRQDARLNPLFGPLLRDPADGATGSEAPSSRSSDQLDGRPRLKPAHLLGHPEAA